MVSKVEGERVKMAGMGDGREKSRDLFLNIIIHDREDGREDKGALFESFGT